MAIPFVPSTAVAPQTVVQPARPGADMVGPTVRERRRDDESAEVVKEGRLRKRVRVGPGDSCGLRGRPLLGGGVKRVRQGVDSERCLVRRAT